MVSMFSFRSRSRSRASKEVDNNGISSGAKKKSSSVVVKSGSVPTTTTTTTKATPMKPIRSTTATAAATTAKDDRMYYSTPETLISPLSSIDDPNKIIVDNSTIFVGSGGGGRVLFDMAPSSPGPAVSTKSHHRKSNNNNNNRRLSHKSIDCDGSSTNSSQATSTDDDMPFMSAFTRSPPSFDKFDDDDIVGLSNIFPVHNGNNNSEWGGIGKRGPWDNTDEFDEDGDDSADPPAILTEWVSSSSSGNEEECERNGNGVVVDNGNAQQSSSMWPIETRSKKSRMSLPSTSSSTNVRQVSPSSSSANVDTAWCNFGAFGDDFFGSGVDFTSGFVDVSAERENGGFPVNVIDDDDDNNFFDNSWLDGDKFGGGSKDQLWTTVTRTQTESSASSYAQNNGSLSLAYTTSLEDQSITSNALAAGDLQPQSQLRNQQQQQQQSHHQLKIPRPPPMEERKPSTGSSVRNKISLSSSNSVGSSRKGGGEGGSVGSNKSNSSAVDQILEHYRRRREQSSGGSVHSGSQMTGISHGSGSAVPSTGTTSMTGSASPSSSSPLVVVTPGTTVKNCVAAIRVDNLADDGLRSSGPIAPLNSNQDTSIDRSTTIVPSSTKSISRSKAPPSRTRRQPTERNIVDVTTDEVMNDNEFLTSILEATIGPRGIAPDLESLSGRSFTGRPARRRDNHRRNGGSSGDSIGSRNSRLTMASHKSFRTYESTKSALTHMSSETRSVANDLFRLEAQLAEQIARQQGDVTRDGSDRSLAPPKNVSYTTSLLGAQPAPRPTSLYTITAPPGKLGILLSNAKVGKVGTYVSAIRSTSVLAGKVHILDIFESIDGEDVTLMTSKEIMNIMASRAEFERELQLRPAPMESN